MVGFIPLVESQLKQQQQNISMLPALRLKYMELTQDVEGAVRMMSAYITWLEG